MNNKYENENHYFQMANLSDLDNHKEMFHHLPLYEAGLLELRHGTIPCRTLMSVSYGTIQVSTCSIRIEVS